MTAEGGTGGPGPLAGGGPRDGAGGHLDDLVADLADGRLAGADPALVLQHLDSCAACRADLADTVVAGAALRQLSESVRPPAVDSAAPATPDGPSAPRPADTSGSEVSRPFRPRHRVGSGGRAGRRRAGAVAGAALLALVVGAAGGVGVSNRTRSPAVATPPTADAGRTAGTVRAVLAGPVGGSPAVGVVVIGGSGATRRMALWTSGLRTPVGDQVYEVWLDGSTPLAVGRLDRAGSGSWVMATSVAAGRSTVLVVRQRIGVSSPGSGDVVARATLS